MTIGLLVRVLLVFVTAISTALAASPPPVAAAPPATDVPDRAGFALVKAKLDLLVAAGTPGAIVEVGDDAGKRVVTSGVGDRDRRTPPVAGRVLRVGSVSKSFLATVVLQLVAERKLALDRPVGEYLPGLLPYREPITVRHLLQHRSGIPDYVSSFIATLPDFDKKRFDTHQPADLVAAAVKKPLGSRPGTKFSYSNTNYTVLGLLVEKLTGQSAQRAVTTRIIDRIGLPQTRYPGAETALPNPTMRGYERLHGASKPFTDMTTYNMSLVWMAGDVISTPADLGRFYDALVSGKLLPRAQLDQMRRPFPSGGEIGYGLGLMTHRACGETLWGHGGNLPGYSVASYVTADGGIRVTAAMNQNNSAPTTSQATLTKAADAAVCARKASG